MNHGIHRQTNALVLVCATTFCVLKFENDCLSVCVTFQMFSACKKIQLLSEATLHGLSVCLPSLLIWSEEVIGLIT